MEPSAKDPLLRLGRGGVLVGFGATWATPWLLTQPMLDALEEKGVSVRRVDIDAWPQHAEQFQILSLPTFVWVFNGKERRRTTGAVSAAELKKFTSRK